MRLASHLSLFPPHFPLIQGLLLVLLVSVTRFVLRLLFAVLLFMGPQYPAISPPLFAGNPRRCVCDPSAREGDERKVKGRSDKRRGTIGWGGRIDDKNVGLE